jgi:hypothetical protein
VNDPVSLKDARYRAPYSKTPRRAADIRRSRVASNFRVNPALKLTSTHRPSTKSGAGRNEISAFETPAPKGAGYLS